MTAPDNGPVAVVSDKARATTLRPIDIAFADYDRTRPLIDGRVKAKGLELRASNKWVGDFGSDKARATTLRPIDIAFADYDRTRPLIDGRVKAKGLELRASNKWVGDF